jgi:hemolysin activation/secretion protein
VFRLGFDVNFRDGWAGTNWISWEYSQGFNILHATDRGAGLVSRTNGRASFKKMTLDITRLQKITNTLALQLSASGQTSPNTLLSSEEFGVGGSRYGRAYDSSDITGNEGAAGSAELQFNPPWKIPGISTYQVYGFYDGGAVWGSGFTRASMVSTGGGFRIESAIGIGASLEIAVPLTRSAEPDEDNGKEPRFFFNLSARF